MAHKRMNKFLVTVRWHYGKKSFDRRIASEGITKQSAGKKVMAKYSTHAMINKMGKPTLISIVGYWEER